MQQLFIADFDKLKRFPAGTEFAYTGFMDVRSRSGTILGLTLNPNNEVVFYVRFASGDEQKLHPTYVEAIDWEGGL